MARIHFATRKTVPGLWTWVATFSHVTSAACPTSVASVATDDSAGWARTELATGRYSPRSTSTGRLASALQLAAAPAPIETATAPRRAAAKAAGMNRQSISMKRVRMR